MRKFFMRKSVMFAIALVVAVAVACAWLYTRPAQWQMQQQAVITAPAEDLFPLFMRLKDWPRWSTWNGAEQEKLEQRYTGSEAGVGAGEIWHFQGQDGLTTITNVIENQQVDYLISAAGGGFLATGSIVLESQGNRTRVTWNTGGDTGGSLLIQAIVQLAKPQIKRIKETSLNKLQQAYARQP